MQKFTNDNGAEVFVMGPEEVAGFLAEVERQRQEADAASRGKSGYFDDDGHWHDWPPAEDAAVPTKDPGQLYRVTWNYGTGRNHESMTATRPFTWAEVEHELLADEGPARRTTYEEWS